ncbi:hypothetical protein N7510_001523 [Penicillium lagena]|uniref:uncharacterized protein n=1 Tax=Penicillium lagena TaxID=94218 RepID=UPI00253FCA36|nr:uncharacterized protein N7510_001523 [Penicillium lagena]KAJ5625214.1 hypothetical protein N7510_001523 [Penicillium lagena]
MNSDSSTSGSYQGRPADLDESNFIRRNRTLHWARLGLSFVILIASVAIIACEAVPLRHYKVTAAWADAGLALWPLNLDTRPTKAALACGCVIAVLNLAYIATALLPSPHSRIKTLNTFSSASAVAGFITALTGVLFTLYPPSSTYPVGFSENETLHSWTCKWGSSHNDIATPIHFARDCAEMRTGFVLLGVLVGLEFIMGLVATVGSWMQRGVARQRADEQHQLEKLEFSTKQ